jgi:hypothetical protein
MSEPITYRLLGPRRYLQWIQIQRIFRLLAIADHFHQLARWATRKRLAGPQRAYQHRIDETEEKLLWIRAEHRGLVVLCEFLYTAYQQITATAPPKRRRWRGGRTWRYPRRRR